MRFQLTGALAWSGIVLVAFLTTARADQAAGTRYARFRVDDREVYGIVQGQRVREIDGDLFGEHRPTDRTHALADVELLVPTEPRQVFALAGNYLSHMTSDTPATVEITHGCMYDLQWRERGGATVPVTDIGNEDMPYTLTGLSPDSEYEYRVRAKANGEKSEWSDWTAFRTRAADG